MLSVETNATVRFKIIFQKLYPQLLVYAIGIVGEEEAEDVVEDVFAELWRRRNETEMGDKIQAFLYKSVYTRALNVLKHRNVTAHYLSLVEGIQEQRQHYFNTSHPHQNLENLELRGQIELAIDELPDKCREVFKMSYIDGMRNSEIATQLGISVKTVEAHMYKALKSLRERLAQVRKAIG